MKQLTCEMCGSTEIKKIDDSTFKCQSCGIEYSKEEVQKLFLEITGSVNLSHDSEIENLLKRANYFLEEGEIEKSKEYCHKVLDLDADNQIAKELLEKAVITQLDNMEKKLFDIQLGEYYVIESNADSTVILTSFFRNLKGIKNIACDIYKEISIRSVWHQYVPFVLFFDEYEADWSAIACYKRYENQIEYRDVRKTYGNKTVWEKEPYTKQVEIIDRVPHQGNETYTACGFTYASDKLCNTLTSIYDKEDNTIDELLKKFKLLQVSKLDSYVNSCKQLEIDMEELKVLKEIPDDWDNLEKSLCPLSLFLNNHTLDFSKYKNLLYYDGTVLDFNEDVNYYTDEKEKAKNNSEISLKKQISGKIGGDFSEQVEINSKFVARESKKICIPVQVIEYEYKGKIYIAIADLVNGDSLVTQFPCDSELTKTKESLMVQSKKPAKLPTAFWIGIAAEVIGLILINTPLLPMAIILMLAAVFLVIGGVCARSKRNKKIESEVSSAKESLYRPRLSALLKSYDAFWDIIKEYSFDEYIDDLKKANDAASISSIKIDKIHTDVCFIENTSKDLKTENIDDNEENIKIINLEKEISKNKKLRNISFCLISGILLIPSAMFPLSWVLGEDVLDNSAVIFSLIGTGFVLTFSGTVLAGIYNDKIAKSKAALKEMQEKWLNN